MGGVIKMCQNVFRIIFAKMNKAAMEWTKSDCKHLGALDLILQPSTTRPTINSQVTLVSDNINIDCAVWVSIILE